MKHRALCEGDNEARLARMFQVIQIVPRIGVSFGDLLDQFDVARIVPQFIKFKLLVQFVRGEEGQNMDSPVQQRFAIGIEICARRK